MGIKEFNSFSLAYSIKRIGEKRVIVIIDIINIDGSDCMDANDDALVSFLGNFDDVESSNSELKIEGMHVLRVL